MRDAFEQEFPSMPSGIILPYRKIAGKPPEVVYADIPFMQESSLYLLMDVLIATGDAIVTCINSIQPKISSPDSNRIIVVAPFITIYAVQRFNNLSPLVKIHTVWHREELEPNGRMHGPGFDIGDYALGGASSRRIQWIRP
jgi:uracil phosphoribosyltransferase